MYIPPRNDTDYSYHRLREILGRKRLRFNPYTVSDKRLMDIVNVARWGDEYDITQATVLEFTRLREVAGWREFDGIYMRVADDPQELFLSEKNLIYGVTAYDTLRQERHWVGRRPIRNYHDIEWLVGKRVFVSRVIRGANTFGACKVAYRMHRLHGRLKQDARTVREAMIEAKIEMLERILKYPQSPDHLSCEKSLINYEPYICQAINTIRTFPQVPIPQD